jgi:hypothetical protein
VREESQANIAMFTFLVARTCLISNKDSLMLFAKRWVEVSGLDFLLQTTSIDRRKMESKAHSFVM